MVSVRLDGGDEVAIAEGGFLSMNEGSGRPEGMYANWEEIPEQVQRRIVELQESLRVASRSLIDLITADLSEFIQSPSEAT